MTETPVLDGVALDRLRRLGGPRLLRQMAELYLEQGPSRIDALREGAAAGDTDRIERAAHTLKSSAGNLGAMRLQRLAEGLEAVAAAGVIDRDAIERTVREYEESATAVLSVLEGIGE